VGRDGGGYIADLGQPRTEIFLQRGLDRKSVICPSGSWVARLRLSTSLPPGVRRNHETTAGAAQGYRDERDGRGLTRLQPAYVEDVAEAIGRIMQRAETPSMIFELGGPRLLLRGNSQSRRAPSWHCAPADSNPVCRLARTGMGLRNTPESTPHSQSGGTDADRHRVIAGNARIW
jgi:hypothetical protein